MTKDEIIHAVDLRKVPKSELDNLWNQFFGFFLFGILFILSLYTLLKDNTRGSVIFFSSTLVLLILFFYFHHTDRKLKSIQNEFTKNQNSERIEKALLSLRWEFEKKDSMYFCEVPFIFGQTGFHLIIFPLDNEILYNLRNVGSFKGRLPFLYGLETLKARKFVAALK